MAERVEIRGGDLDGSVLDNAATEATLLRLVNLMEKSTGTSGASSGSNKLQDMYNRSLNSSSKGLNTAAKSSSTLGNSFNAATKAISETTGVIGNLLGKTFGAAVSGAAFAVNGLKDFLMSSYTEFKGLSESGAAFNNNMVEASKFALSTGMSLRDFTGLIQKNNTVLTSLGGTATEGAKRLARLSDEIRTGGVGESLFGLGMTTNDINDFLGSYLEQQQRLGSLQRKDDKELREGTRLYAEELDKVSKLTGIERKRLDEQAKKQSLDPVINLLKRGLSPEELAKSTANLAAVAEIGGQELQDAVKEIATGVVRSDLARNLQRTGALTRESAQGLVKGQLDAGKVLQNTGRILKDRNELNSKEILMANEGLNKTAALRDKLIKLDGADLDRRDQEAEKRDKLTTAFGRFPAILDNIRNKVFGAFLNSKFFQTTIDFLNRMADSINRLINKIDFSNLINNFLGTMDSAFDGISKGVSPLFNKIGSFFKTTLQSIDFDRIGYTISQIFNKISNVFKSILDKINFDKIGESIAKAFKGMTDIFVSVFGSINFDMIGGWISTAFDKITNFFSSVLNGIDFNKISEVAQKVFGAAIITFNDILEKYVFPMIEKASGIMQQIAPKIGPIISDFGDVIVGVFEFITDTVMPILAPVGNLILDSINPIVDIIGGLMKVLKGVFTGNFTVAMDGMSQVFEGIGDQISVLTSWFKETWNAFGSAFQKMGDFFSSIPLYIEKYISEMSVLGSLAQKAGLVRSTEEIDKDLQKKQEQDIAKTAIASPLEIRTKQQIEDQKEKNLISTTQNLASGMKSPGMNKPGVAGTQNLTREETQNAINGNATRQTTAASTSANTAKVEAETTIENLKNIEKAMQALISNSPTQEQTKQLNTLLEQLIEISKQQLEANQDLVKAAKGSYNPL